MNDFESSGENKTVIIQQPPRRRWLIFVLLFLLGLSFLFNLGFMGAFYEYIANTEPPYERLYSGELTASDKIARIAVDFTIMPPYSQKLMEQIEAAEDDDAVKGVILIVDSPGGLVSDSHQIYHKLKKLRESKPVYVSMKGIAASGGYYIAMGGSLNMVYAEPTTWTGSIGVILPRYNLKELGDMYGVASEPLTTGPLKDTLNPLKDLTEKEVEVWSAILDESFQRFLTVIDEGRPNLSKEQVKELATGQVYTASQALANGLVDQIGYESDATDALVQQLGLGDYRVVTYEHPTTLAEQLMGASAQVRAPNPLEQILEAGVPRAMYMFGWHHGLKN